MYIRHYRKKKGLTMKELAALVGVTESTISLYETGKREPNFETLLKLGEILDCTSDELLRGPKELPSGVSDIMNLIDEYPVLERLLYAGGKALQVNEPLVMAVIQALEACDNATKK